MHNPHLSDPLFHRHAILLQFMNTKKTIYEGYKELCDLLGTCVMSYDEYVFWFRRFQNGNFELNYDRSQDPDPKTFAHLPFDVVERIIQKTSYREMKALYDVSKGMRHAVQESRIVFDEGSIEFGDRWLEMKFDDYQYEYQQDYTEIESGSETDEDDDDPYPYVDYEKEDKRTKEVMKEFARYAIDDMAEMVRKLPKVKFNKFRFLQNFNFAYGWEKVLEKRKIFQQLQEIRLRVKEVVIDLDPDFSNNLLYMIDSTTLEKISYKSCGPNDKTFYFLQWGQAKIFEIKSYDRHFPVNNLKSFKEVKLNFRDISWLFREQEGEKEAHLEYAREVVNMFRDSWHLKYLEISWSLAKDYHDLKTAAPENGLDYLRRVKSETKNTRHFEFEGYDGSLCQMTIEYKDEYYPEGAAEWKMILKSYKLDY